MGISEFNRACDAFIDGDLNEMVTLLDCLRDMSIYEEVYTRLPLVLERGLRDFFDELEPVMLTQREAITSEVLGHIVDGFHDIMVILSEVFVTTEDVPVAVNVFVCFHACINLYSKIAGSSVFPFKYFRAFFGNFVVLDPYDESCQIQYQQLKGIAKINGDVAYYLVELINEMPDLRVLIPVLPNDIDDAGRLVEVRSVPSYTKYASAFVRCVVQFLGDPPKWLLDDLEQRVSTLRNAEIIYPALLDLFKRSEDFELLPLLLLFILGHNLDVESLFDILLHRLTPPLEYVLPEALFIVLKSETLSVAQVSDFVTNLFELCLEAEPHVVLRVLTFFNSILLKHERLVTLINQKRESKDEPDHTLQQLPAFLRHPLWLVRHVAGRFKDYIEHRPELILTAKEMVEVEAKKKAVPDIKYTNAMPDIFAWE
ncbi:hypothetical protein PCE1_000544 [Barthelona sp. PCE]